MQWHYRGTRNSISAPRRAARLGDASLRGLTVAPVFYRKTYTEPSVLDRRKLSRMLTVIEDRFGGGDENPIE
jgi:hypothetical protein